MSPKSGAYCEPRSALRDTRCRKHAQGEVALDVIREQRFDVILLDYNMPGMGGLEVCGLIRGSSEVAIIMLTIRDSEHDKVAALDAGADDYVTKPFGTPELLARIRAALVRRQAGCLRRAART